MREALRREAVEVTAHQLEVERSQASRHQGADLMVSLALLGATAAVGFQLYDKGRRS
jgi:hypothetical protein